MYGGGIDVVLQSVRIAEEPITLHTVLMNSVLVQCGFPLGVEIYVAVFTPS